MTIRLTGRAANVSEREQISMSLRPNSASPTHLVLLLRLAERQFAGTALAILVTNLRVALWVVFRFFTHVTKFSKSISWASRSTSASWSLHHISPLHACFRCVLASLYKMRSRISMRGCVHRSVGQSVTQELKSCFSAVFDQNWDKEGSETG